MKLYCLEADNGKCKVGISDDVISRLKGLESAGGFKITNLFYVEMGDKALAAEQAIHRKLKDCRERTSFGGYSEWFTARFTHALAAVLEQVYVVGLWLDTIEGASMGIRNPGEEYNHRYDDTDMGYVHLPVYADEDGCELRLSPYRAGIMMREMQNTYYDKQTIAKVVDAVCSGQTFEEFVLANPDFTY